METAIIWCKWVSHHGSQFPQPLPAGEAPEKAAHAVPAEGAEATDAEAEHIEKPKGIAPRRGTIPSGHGICHVFFRLELTWYTVIEIHWWDVMRITCIYVYTHTYIYIYIYIYTHTYIYIYMYLYAYTGFCISKFTMFWFWWLKNSFNSYHKCPKVPLVGWFPPLNHLYW